MSLSFAGAGNGSVQTRNGDEIAEIVVESLNFKALNGENKVKLLRQAWPANDLPSSTSSLLSISSRQGLLAAAGPTSLILARTKDVRDAFSKEGGGQIKDFQPALEIPVPKLSQVAFTADGTFLVICAQEGGGLGVYETQSILQDKKDPAFQLPTNSMPVRALSPNPAPEFAHLVAVILLDGKLLIADLKSKTLIQNGTGSPALKEGVAAVSWSNRGKQLTAGMSDGNCFQLDQSGAVKATIPAPQLPVPCHVSSLVWLSNNEWLIYHTPNAVNASDSQAPESYLHYVEADKDRTQIVYRAPIADPVGNWGLKRTPITHYIARLRNWHTIKDWVVLSSVASLDVAMLTNSSAPLVSDTPVVGSYAITAFANDASRMSVPLSADTGSDTSPIGMALDFSSTDRVPQPIPGDEMDESPFPLPALMLLNNEGILVSSWVVYNEALRNNLPCPDMLSTSQSAGALTSPPQTPQTSAFGATASPAPAFGNSAFAKPAAPSFASFGGGTATPAFGGAGQIGARQSVWGGGGAAAAAKPPGAVFGQSGLGDAKPAFGAPSAFGAAAGTNGASALGKPAEPASTKPAVSPFSAFAGSGNNAAKSATPNPFGAFSGSGSTASPFGSTATGTQSAFGQPSKPGQSAFATSGTTIGSTPAASFGMSSQPSFGSTVSVDTSTGGSTLGGKSVFGTPAQPGGAGLFNKPTLTPAESRESDMMDGETPREEKPAGGLFGAPKQEKPAGGLFGSSSGGFKLGTTFKPGNQEDKSDSEEEREKPKTDSRPKGLFGADFGAALGDAQKEREKSGTPKIKTEESEESPSLFGVPLASNKKEDDKPKHSVFGSSTTPAKPNFSFGKPSTSPAPSQTPSSHFLRADPVPPESTSKQALSPSTTTATNSEGKTSSSASKDNDGKDDSDTSVPVAGSEAGAVEMPDSDDEFSEEGEIEEEAPLPPDPKTVKVAKGFYETDRTLGTQSSMKPLEVKSPAQTQPKLLFGEHKEEAEIKSPAPKASLFGNSTTPSGFPRPTQMFAPPVPAAPKSPRSPSPMRSASTPAGRPIKPPSRPSSRAQFPPSQRPTPPPRQQTPPPPPPVVTPASLQDKEADRNRAILESDTEPTLHLPKYISHQDYLGGQDVRGDGKVSTQIETLFRDINSMVDTLGLNARALTEFIQGHNSLMPDEGRGKEDLDLDSEDEDDEGSWCLVEIDELMAIERGIGEELGEVGIEDKEGKVAESLGRRRELVKAKGKIKEIKRFIEQTGDEGKKEQRKNAPLDKGTEMKQREIRQETAKFLRSLVEAEEAVSMLKVKLAGTGKQGRGQVPTVEAVEKTVRKMTQWAEEKGADMDVLEAQMRKLGLVAVGGHGRHSSRNSLNGSTNFRRSILSTPSPAKANARKPSPAKKSSSFAVPEESESESEDGKEGEAFVEVDPREEVVRGMLEGRRRRGVVLGKFREAMRRRGVPVTTPP